MARPEQNAYSGEKKPPIRNESEPCFAGLVQAGMDARRGERGSLPLGCRIGETHRSNGSQPFRARLAGGKPVSASARRRVPASAGET
jgi:hypothetical protein